MTQLRRVFPPSVAMALLICSLSFFSSAFSQTALSQRLEPRLKGSITGSARVVMADSRTPRVRDAQDLGAVSPEMVVPGVTLVFRRSAAQEATLQELLAAQQDTASPLYHQWLTPESFAARFGMADEDLATTESWLESRGLHVDSVARSRDRITFSGTAAQLQAAFGAELHHYRAEGAVHFAPAADLTLPAELAPMTAAVLHLSDFRPKPNVKALSEVKPEYTTAPGEAHYLVPADLASMYDLYPFHGTSTLGTGQSVAIVGQSLVNQASIQAFSYTTAGNLSLILVPGSGVEAYSPGDEGESEIDVEYSSGIANGAQILLVFVGASQNYDVFDAIAYAITTDIAPVVSISYGACEAVMSATDLQQDNALYEEAAAQGQTLVAASGDSGSTTCAPYSTSQGVTVAQQQALAVSFPASSPYVTAVGGTQMAAGTFAAGSNSYWDGATNVDMDGSLISYVPEVVWNEGSSTVGIAAGGGGTSTVFPRPSWQSSGPGLTGGSYRLVPDVALQASIFSPGYLLCSSDQTLISPQTASCTSGLKGSNNQYTQAGGTSFAAPVFAGFVAMLNQYEGASGQGNMNSTLYGLAGNATTYSAAFHDIMSGTNACTAGSGNCGAPGESNYRAGVGYDEATGLGSLDFYALAKAWPVGATKSLSPLSIFLYGTTTTASPGATIPIPLMLYAEGDPAAPVTGTLAVSVDGVVVNPSLALTVPPLDPTTATGTYNFVAPATAGGHFVQFAYSGDAKNAPAKTTYAVMVGNVVASGSVSLTSSSISEVNGGTGSSQITVTPAGGYNGLLVWSLSATAAAGSPSLTACYSIAALPVNGVSTAKLTIGTGTACSSALPAMRGALHVVGQSAAARKPDAGTSRSATLAAMYAGVLLCGLLAGGRRRVRMPLLLTIACLAVLSSGLTGCGGGGGSSTVTTPPTPAANYTITLTGKDSVNMTISASTTFTLTVN